MKMLPYLQISQCVKFSEHQLTLVSVSTDNTHTVNIRHIQKSCSLRKTITFTLCLAAGLNNSRTALFCCREFRDNCCWAGKRGVERETERQREIEVGIRGNFLLNIV